MQSDASIASPNNADAAQSCIDFMQHQTIQSCISRYEENLVQKELNRYNLFTLSSYNNQLENFHSDVIVSLLDARGLHGEGKVFLELFIRFLNDKLELNLNSADFIEAQVYREIGDAASHIDIAIIGGGKSIIIENKMNNAPDMPEQLDRYYHYLTQVRKTEVQAIIYLTLDGLKNAPTPDDIKAKDVLRNLAAYNNTENDLVSGWLTPCFAACTRDDSRSLIHQYIKLIKHLASKNMDNQVMEDFYRFVADKRGIDTLEEVVELASRIPIYRIDKLISAIKDYKPFKYSGKWKYNYQCYDGFKDGNNTFKFDIAFERDGTCFMWFWIPLKPDKSGGIIVYEKLKSIGLEKEFKPRDENENGYTKFFKLGDDYKTMPEMDEAVLKFVKSFLEKLRVTQV